MWLPPGAGSDETERGDGADSHGRPRSLEPIFADLIHVDHEVPRLVEVEEVGGFLFAQAVALTARSVEF
jgi:hypothetical protein